MDFVKKHYEKILLGAVLLGLVGALVFLPFMVAGDREKQEAMRLTIIHRKAMPLPALNLTAESNVLQRLQSPYQLDFSTTNKLFNPVEWKKDLNGNLIKIETGNEIGAGAAVVTKIKPLDFILTFDSVETNEFGARYVISVERQAAENPEQRRKRQHYVSVGEKNDAFTLQSIQGSCDNPSQLTLTLTDTGETVTLTKQKPFVRVDGYMADLKYDPEKKVFSDRRMGSILPFAGDDYIIVAINQSGVVLSAESNQKKTTLPYTP